MKKILTCLILFSSFAAFSFEFKSDGRKYFVYSYRYDRTEYLRENDPHYPDGYWSGTKFHHGMISVDMGHTKEEPDSWTFIHNAEKNQRIDPKDLERVWDYVGYMDEYGKFTRIYKFY